MHTQPPAPPPAPPRPRAPRSSLRRGLLVGSVGLATAAVVGLGLPALAATTDDSTTATQAVGDRLSRIKDALSGLVSDGTITQDQADKVAETLDDALPQRGDGPPGMGLRGFGADLATLASTLDLTVDELHTELHSGKTLAEIAEDQGVSTTAVVDAVVEAATARIDDAVADGRLTAEQAATMKAGLRERGTTFVTEGGPLGRMGGMGGPGRHGGHGWDRDGDDDGATTPTPEPSASAQGSRLDT